MDVKRNDSCTSIVSNLLKVSAEAASDIEAEKVMDGYGAEEMGRMTAILTGD